MLDQGNREIGRAVTDAAGRYDIAGLPPVVVTLRAELPGFTTAQASSIALSATGTAQRDLRLTVSSREETVTVTAASPGFRPAPRPRGGVAGGISSNFAAAPPPGENMSALKGSSSERRLLERYTRQLDEQETRLDALKRERAALAERHQRADRELNELIAALTLDITP